MDKKIVDLTDASELERAFPVLKELRPHLDFSDFKEIYEQARGSDGYRLVAIEKDEKFVALMGFRFLSDFVRGRHLYIDDLVSTESMRSKGYGSDLLKYAEQVARESKCKSLRLCTGVENERGVKFYEDNGWTRRSYAYVKKMS